jgi:Ras-related protein Rab-6A
LQTIRIKVVLVGESGVGKSSLIKRFVYDEFDDHHVVTLGAKVVKKEVYPDIPGQAVRALMQIWDLMGAHTLRDLLQDSYFSGAQGALAVFDLGRPESLRYLDEWIRTVFQVTGPIPIIIVGNKADLWDQGVLPRAKIDDLVRRRRSRLYTTSAKLGMNVDTVFTQLAGEVIRSILEARGVPPPPPPPS